MAPYRRVYVFTSEPDAAKNPADWLAALKTNIYSCTTNREKVNLFSSKLFCGSPAKKWFNKLPDEGHQRWHLVKQEFESRWCKSPGISDAPSLVALLSMDTPVNIPIPSISCPLPVPDVDEHYSTPPSSPTLPPHPLPTPQNPKINVPDICLSILLNLLAARDIYGVADFCRLTADTEHCNFALIWDLAFEAGKSFAQQEQDSLKKLMVTTSEAASQTSPSAASIPLPTPTPALLLSPVPISSVSPPIKHTVPIPTSIPQPSSEPSWADDSNSIPIIQLIKPPRDLSCLHLETEPFSTLRHQNR
ncbi:hypothetical protein BDZ97DRAFT_1760094 [Flammula alnicola]|nr:hypothetical protein BDZ97DRAFT_1760094 [Flammula alnicola]